MVAFGQVVIGAPGAGKTTFCAGMQQMLNLLGRKTAVINLDPANDDLPYDCAVNIEDLIRLEDVMNQYNLGPNGGLVYCMDYLEKNVDWLEEKLQPLQNDHYLLFDFPGQVELFTLHDNAKNILDYFTKKLNYRLVAINLVDCHLCCEASKYVSALLFSLSTMLHLALPHINVLSKIDLMAKYGELDFNLDFYTEVQDLHYLQAVLNAESKSKSKKMKKMNTALCEIIEDFSIVNFTTLDIQDKESVVTLLKLIDKTNGYVFAGIEGSVKEYSKIAAGPMQWDSNPYPSLHFYYYFYG